MAYDGAMRIKPRYVGTRAIARLLGCPLRTVQAWVQFGTLPSIRVTHHHYTEPQTHGPGRYLVPVEAIRALLEQAGAGRPVPRSVRKAIAAAAISLDAGHAIVTPLPAPGNPSAAD